MRHYYEPHNHEQLYYIRYTYDNGYSYEVREVWFDNEEEYTDWHNTWGRHARYDLLIHRPPMQAGLMQFGR